MKKVLVIGGSGALGKSVVNTFKKNNPIWKVMSIDYRINENADDNFILNKNENGILSTSEISKLSTQNFYSEKAKLDLVINVAGGWVDGNLESNDVIQKFHLMMSMNLYSSILAVHLAKIYLKPNSLLVLTGANSVKEGIHTWMIQYQMSKNSVHYLTDILIKNKNELPENTKLITILPETIDTDNNRKSMPDADFSQWTSPDKISGTIKNWADSKKYPEEIYFKI